jgi:hypothetical protein
MHLLKAMRHLRRSTPKSRKRYLHKTMRLRLLLLLRLSPSPNLRIRTFRLKDD